MSVKWFVVPALWILPGPVIPAATVWDGPILSYTQPGRDPTQPANQDRLTPEVWLTRASSAGLFNARAESSFIRGSSPTGTEWAYGQLSDYSTLSYRNWEAWHGNNPPSSLGRDAVLHLISEDIYLRSASIPGAALAAVSLTIVRPREWCLNPVRRCYCWPDWPCSP